MSLGLGAQLRSARERQGLSLEQCAERIYVHVSLLTAMENEDFQALGAGVYARGHLRRYAGLLEIDPAGLELLLQQRLAAAPDLTAIVTRGVVGNTKPVRRMALLPVAIATVALTIAALAWWSSRHVGESLPQQVAAPAAPIEQPVPEAVPAPVPVPAPASSTPPQHDAVEPTTEGAAIATKAPPLVVAAAPARTVAPRAAAPRAATSQPPAAKSDSGSSTSQHSAAKPAPAPSPPPPRDTQSDYMNFEF